MICLRYAESWKWINAFRMRSGKRLNREHIEARAEHLGIEIVDLLTQLLQVDLNNAGETVEK
jgi:hypothetical protein